MLLWVNQVAPKIVGTEKPGIYQLSFLKYYLCDCVFFKTIFINIQSDQVQHSLEVITKDCILHDNIRKAQFKFS